MNTSCTFLLAGAWSLLACLSSGCRETPSLHSSSEVGMVFDYIVRHDSLEHDKFVVVPADFHRYTGVTDTAAFHGRTARLSAYLDSTLRPILQPKSLAMPNVSEEWRALRAQLPTAGTEANAVFLAFSARCDGRDGRHYYYVERYGVENGRRSGAYEGDIYQVYQGHIEREFHVWIS